MPTLILWDKIRVELAKHSVELFSGPSAFNFERALKVLMDSNIEAEETLCFFDMIFDIS